MLRAVYFLIVTTHILYTFLVLSVAPLVLKGKLAEFEERFLIASVIILALVLNIIYQDCPLTAWQRKIEIRLKPWEKPTQSFIRENLAQLKINLSEKFIARATVFFVILDLFFLFLA